MGVGTFFAAPTWAAHVQLHTPALCSHGRDNPGWVTQKHPPLLQEYPGTGMWKPGGLCLGAGAQEEGRMNTLSLCMRLVENEIQK